MLPRTSQSILFYPTLLRDRTLFYSGYRVNLESCSIQPCFEIELFLLQVQGEPRILFYPTLLRERTLSYSGYRENPVLSSPAPKEDFVFLRVQGKPRILFYPTLLRDRTLSYSRYRVNLESCSIQPCSERGL